MPSYVPRNVPDRKRGILKKRVDTLLRLLKLDSPSKKIARAAEIVREAQINLLKAKKDIDQSLCSEDESLEKTRRREKLDKETTLWEQSTIKEIIELYRKQIS